MHVRCPHCQNAIEIVGDDELEGVTCPSCGSDFNLVPETESYTPKTRTIGHFQLLEQLGAGGFGTVWKAKDSELDRFVAVKIPRRDQVEPENVEMFLREARAAAQLKHPQIVAVHEVGRDDGTLYIVSDFIQGVTLADRLTQGPFTPREAAELCAQIADALHHAHEAGVIHRDLKPQNIMLDGDGQPHIMDFGLAKREAGEITMTVDGKVLGTAAYMSPEQARGEAHRVDRRTDVYSLGVILFELLTGERPFRGNVRMLLHQVIHDEPRRLRSLKPKTPRDMETICLKCLSKIPVRRYGTAQMIADDLRRYLAGQPILARPVSRIERSWRWVKHNQMLTTLWVVIASFILIFGLLLQGYFNGNSAQLVAEEKLDKEFSFELQKLREDVTAVSGGDREAIGKLRATAEALQQRNRASLELRKQVEPLLAKLDQKSLEDDSQRKERTARAAVVQAIGNPAIFVDALAAYAKAAPQSARGAHFTKVAADDAPLLPAVELWNRLVEKWSQRDFSKVTPDEAKLLLAELKAIVQSHPRFPAQSELKSLEPYLQAVQARVDDGGTRIYRWWLTALDDPRINTLSMLLLDSRKRHYFEKEPVPDPLKPGNLIFFLFSEPMLENEKCVRTSLPLAQVSNPRVARPTLLNTFDWTSPQQRFRKKAIDLLDHCTDNNWEPTFSALLVAVDQEPLMEPTLQLYLKQTILDLGVRGSHCLKLGFEPTLAIMGERSADIEANWIDPADDVGNRARQAAEEMLARLPDQRAALKVAKSHLDSLGKRRRGAQYDWVGCLIKDEGGQWRLELPRLAAGWAGPLVVLRRDAVGAVFAETIAQPGPQPPVLDAKGAGIFLEGRPVYMASDVNWRSTVP